MTARRIEVIKNHLAPNRVAAEEYQFTLTNTKLTKEQRDFYEINGFIVIKKLLPAHILERCRKRFIELCNGADKGQMTLMKEINVIGSDKTGEELYQKVQDIFHDDDFSSYSEYPELLEYVECFTGPNIMGMHSMLVNKPPGSSIHPPHQDLHYFPFRPVNRVVASWTAMEPVFKENGCLYVVPGSHRGKLYNHEYPKNDRVNSAFHGIQNFEEVAPESKRVYVEMDIGDTIFFHPTLIHGSGPNLTKKCRKAISCHFASSECYFIDVKGTSQENIAREIVQIVKRKGWGDATFQEFWIIKGKNLKGKRMNL